MTVINSCIQGKRAFIMTDMAVTDKADGKLLLVASKFTKSNSSFNWVYTVTGNVDLLALLHEISRHEPHNIGTLTQAIEQSMRDLTAREPTLEINVVLAVWDKKEARPRLFAFRGDDIVFQTLPTKFEPYEITFHVGSSEDVSEVLGRPVDMHAPCSFDPYVDSIPLIEAQRRNNTFEHHGFSAYRIGGGIQVASVGRRGVHIRDIHTWPDKVGEMIDPYAPAGESIG